MLRPLCIIGSLLILITGCQQSSVKEEGTDAYPLGRDDRAIDARYEGDLPIFVRLPPTIPGQKVPVVLFNHGRPFSGVASGRLDPADYEGLITTFNQKGIAVALAVRRGYLSTPGFDGERIPCDRPGRFHFEQAGRAASKNIVSALNYLSTVPEIDSERMFVGGVSAGGFASVYSIPSMPPSVRGVFTLSGGRCGNRGDSINGLSDLEAIYAEISSNSQTPIMIVAGTEDRVVPPYSSRRLYESICRARGTKCKDSVEFVEARGAQHSTAQLISLAGVRVVQFVQRHLE